MAEKFVKEVKVEESVRDYVESLDYEYAARKEAVAFMLSNNMNVTTDSFKSYQKEMVEFGAQFTKAKGEIEKKYVFPVIGDKHVNWSLDYETATITITEL